MMSKEMVEEYKTSLAQLGLPNTQPRGDKPIAVDESLNILNDVRAVTDSEMNCFLNRSLLQLHQQAAGAARQTNTLTSATVVTY
jgi:hypothetical protein